MDVIRLTVLKFAKLFAVSWLTEWNWRAVHKCQVFLLSYSNWGQIFHMPVLLLWDKWLLSQEMLWYTEDKADKMQAGKQSYSNVAKKQN